MENPRKKSANRVARFHTDTFVQTCQGVKNKNA
jgi:hypothetical protein